MFTSLVPGYCIYRVDRQGRSGGVALLYHNSVMSSSPIAICVDGLNLFGCQLLYLLLGLF